VKSKAKRQFSYFENGIELKLVAAQAELLGKINEANSAAAMKGALGGSRRYLELQSVAFNEISLLGDFMCQELARHDVSHSPIKSSDFHSSKLAVEAFAETVQKAYADIARRGTDFGNRVPELDVIKLDTVVLTAKHRIDGEEQVYRSKTSMWKWMWHDVRTKSWSAFLIFIGGVLAWSISYFWSKVITLIDFIQVG